MAQKRSPAEQKQVLQQIAKKYYKEPEFKKQIDQAYAKAKADQQVGPQLAQMEQQYGENQAKIIFAYQLLKSQSEKNATQQAQNQSSPYMAKMGTKLEYIALLNGHCPEGYEMFKKGGCIKCKKGTQLQLQQQLAAIKVKPRFNKCGGKAKKHLNGGTLNVLEPFL